GTCSFALLDPLGLRHRGWEHGRAIPLAVLSRCSNTRHGNQSYSTSSSASCWRCRGTLRPSALAALRLMTSSNFVGNSIGMSDALLPLSILFTTEPARRHTS